MPNVPNTSNTQASDTSQGNSTKYFRSVIPTLEVVVGDPDPTQGHVAHEVVRFEPYFEERKGVEGKVKVGYLATDNASAIKKLKTDFNVEEINGAEYNDATEDGERAPF